MTHDARIPAAQYLRMSTEQQQYSLDNQAEAIQRYARAHNFSVVETFADGGKSGITLKHRTALAQLLATAVGGKATFKAVLVYDVSRWGRFQDADEAAHYEFLCKSAGIPVYYCAEQFPNDGTMADALLKALKRTMAGEFSRELSAKAYEGQKRLAQLGYRCGGVAGYGLQRMMISTDQERNKVLLVGEYKQLKTDRVILVPGAKEEVETVQEIYRLFLAGPHSSGHVARELNRRGLTLRGRPWNKCTIWKILTCPKYVGANVWGQTAVKLKGPSHRVQRSRWIVKPDAFAPVVDKRTYERVQEILANRTCRKTNEDILCGLQRLLAEKGKLSENVIEQCPYVPSLSTIQHRFGKLSLVYKMIGYRVARQSFLERPVARKKTQLICERLVSEIAKAFPSDVIAVHDNKVRKPVLKLRCGITVSVLVARAVETPLGYRRWLLWPLPRERRRVVLLVRANERRDGFHDLWVLPGIQHRAVAFKIRENDKWLKCGIRLRKISEFYELATTVQGFRL